MSNNKISCPLMGQEIEDGICFDIHMVVEGGAPLWTAPQEAVEADNFREICLSCPNHRDD